LASLLAVRGADAKFAAIEQRRIAVTRTYNDAGEACNAAFIGGPVALACSRYSDAVRARVRARHLETIDSWRDGHGSRMPGEFVIVAAIAPG
jgi:hypothetical protein